MKSPWDFSDRPMMSFHKLPEHILPPCWRRLIAPWQNLVWPIGLALNLSKFLTPDVSSLEGGFLLKNHSLERVSRELWDIPNRNLIEAWVQIFKPSILSTFSNRSRLFNAFKSTARVTLSMHDHRIQITKREGGSSLVSNGLHRTYFGKTWYFRLPFAKLTALQNGPLIDDLTIQTGDFPL